MLQIRETGTEDVHRCTGYTSEASRYWRIAVEHLIRALLPNSCLNFHSLSISYLAVTSLSYHILPCKGLVPAIDDTWHTAFSPDSSAVFSHLQEREHSYK